MSDLFGNHIVGFPTRRLICSKFQIAKNHNSLYVETSSKSGTNVQQAFTDLVQSIIDVVRFIFIMY